MKSILNIFFKELGFAFGIIFYSTIMLNGLGLIYINTYKIFATWLLYTSVNLAITLTSTGEE